MPSLILLIGITDLRKLALIGPKALFTVFGVSVASIHAEGESVAVLAIAFSAASLLI
tara:strand:- start:1545 stop:1715 length:171 start_codon:yes stop_codon:yes gene_type:complete